MTNTPFSPPPGLTSDDTVFAAPGRWGNGSLARFYQGGWQIKGGWERLTLDNLGGVCRSVHTWTDTVSVLDIAFGLHNGLKVWQGSLLSDIAPVGFVPGQIDGTGGAGVGTGAYGVGTYGTPSTVEFFPLTWSLDNWGGDLLANPRGRGIYQWEQDPLVRAIPLPGAPAKVTYMQVAPQRQVFAFGCNEQVSGVFNDLCIRWSDIEDNTDWVPTSANNAGEWILESGGRIVCARFVGDYAYVWTSDGLFMGTFVGAPGQTWKFERVGMNCGAISPGAPVVRSQAVMWISPDRVFWTCALGGAPQIVDCPIRQMFVDHIVAGQDDKIVGTSTSTFRELTWFWPDDRDGGFEPSRAVSFNPDGWSRDVLARSAYTDAGPQPFPVGVHPNGRVYWQEKGHSDDGAPLTGYLESTDFYLGEAEGGVLVNGIWPDFRNQQGPMLLTIRTREFPQSPQRPHGPWSLSPGQAKRDFRLSGRIACIRYDWSSAPAFARGGKSELDVQRIGGR